MTARHQVEEAAALEGARDQRPLDTVTMRETAGRACQAGAVDADELEALMRGHVALLLPEVRAVARRRTAGHKPAAVALIGADEVERRLAARPGRQPDALQRHLRKLAMGVIALCDHYDRLSEPS